MQDIEELPTAFELTNRDIVRAVISIFQKEKFAQIDSLSNEDLDNLKLFVAKLIALVNRNFQVTNIDVEKFVVDYEKLPKLYPKSFQEIKKRDIDKFPPFFQLLLLIQYLHTTQKKDCLIKTQWLMIAMIIAIRLEMRGLSKGKNSYYHQIILRIKLAVFSPSVTYNWLWRYLSDTFFQIIQSASSNSFILQLIYQLNECADAYIDDVFDSATIKQRLKRAKQLTKIATLIEVAFYPRRKRKAEARERQRDKEQTQQAQNLTQEEKLLRDQNHYPSLIKQVTQTPVVEKPSFSYYPVRNNQDIESYQPSVKQQYFLSHSSNSTLDELPTSIEENLDNLEPPLLAYDRPAGIDIRHSVPLQQTELTLQQLYMSRRDFRFNSDTRLLSAIAYQLVFARLLFDAMQDNDDDLLAKRCASMLLLSFITAMPLQTLIQPHFIRTSSLFDIKKTQANLVYQLGITKRKIEQSHLTFENESDWVKLPLPIWLIQFVIKPVNLPTIADINDYLAKIREQVGLPYLSINRIETALEVVLSRQIQGSNAHITALICRTPAMDAPAIFYSSHTNIELITHYQNALAWLDFQGRLDLNYIKKPTPKSIGSGFALTVESVKSLVANLKHWVMDSSNALMLFNRFSAYIWLVLCLLTGIRPNNAIGNIREIDIDMGWMQVCDKPNRNVKNHRLIPLCDSLIQHLEFYQQFLARFRIKMMHKPKISRTLQLIHTEDVDVTLLNLVNETYDNLVAIKRGDIYRFIKEFVDLDPYWTRHFVRTQLEKRQTPMFLINSIIGHEKNNQEALGKFSSASNRQIHSVSHQLEKIAVELELCEQQNWFKDVQKKLVQRMEVA